MESFSVKQRSLNVEKSYKIDDHYIFTNLMSLHYNWLSSNKFSKIMVWTLTWSHNLRFLQRHSFSRHLNDTVRETFSSDVEFTDNDFNNENYLSILYTTYAEYKTQPFPWKIFGYAVCYHWIMCCENTFASVELFSSTTYIYVVDTHYKYVKHHIKYHKNLERIPLGQSL